jgi:chromosome segregation ATPase
VSKSRISVLEKELQNISQALKDANDEAVSSELAGAELKESIELRNKEEDRLTAENRRLLDERDSLLTQGRMQMEATENLEKCLQEIESKESSPRQEVSEYEALLETAQQEHEVSRKRLESVEEELQRSTGEVAGSKEAVEELKGINGIQTQENDRLTMQNRQLLEERESMQLQLRERIEEIETLEKRLNEMELKEALLLKDIEDYRAIILAAQDDHLQSKLFIKEKTKQNNLQKGDIDRLTMESRQLLEERESMQTQLRERIEEIETLHNTQKDADSQNKLDGRQVAEYKSLLESAEHDNEEFKKRIEEMEKDLEKIVYDLECANSEVEGSKKAVEEVSKTNGVQKEENGRLRIDLESQSDRLQSQSEQLSSSEERIALLTAEAEAWDEERKMLKEALEQQDGKVEALSKELSQICEDSQALETSLRDELESSKAEHTALKDKTLEETGGVGLLKKELEKAQTSIEGAQRTMAQLAEECESLRAKEQEQLQKIVSLENQIKDATPSETADHIDLSELLLEERARCEMAEKEVETSRDRIEQLEHSLKAQQGLASTYQKSIEFLEENIRHLEDTKIGVPGDDAQEVVLEEGSEPSCSVDEELQMSGEQTIEDHETQQGDTLEANKNAKESNSSTMVGGGPNAADGTHLNQEDYIKSIVARQKTSAGPNNKRGWAPRLSDVFNRVPGMNDNRINDPAGMDTLETQNAKLQSDLVKLQARYKDESYNNRKKLKELEEDNLAILKKYAALVEK